MNIIDIIEQLRIENKVSKSDLCNVAGLHKNMYNHYLKGTSMSFESALKMLNYLGYDLVLTKSAIKL